MEPNIFTLLTGDWLHVFSGSLILLLTIMNPLGMLALFMGVTANFSKEERKSISIKSSIAIAIILVSVTWLGVTVLNFFGISVAVFEVGGGTLLFLGCLPMVRPALQKPLKRSKSSSIDDIAIVPLAFPIVAGPASILQVIICLEIYGNNIATKSILTLSALIAVLVLFIFFYFCEFFVKIIGMSGLRVIKILVGLILLAIAVNTVTKGLITLIHTLS